MTSNAQRKAVRKHRERMQRIGLGRFEVQGRLSDKQLLRALAKKLAENGADAARVRQALAGAVAAAPEEKGALWAALRRSPLVGAQIDFGRVRGKPREIQL